MARRTPFSRIPLHFRRRGYEELGIERDLEGNLCCQISWSFHGQRQTI